MLLDRVSQFLAQMGGLPILVAVGLVVLNLVLQFVQLPLFVALADANVFLHLGVIVGLLGVLLSDALGAW